MIYYFTCEFDGRVIRHGTVEAMDKESAYDMVRDFVMESFGVATLDCVSEKEMWAPENLQSHTLVAI